MTSFAVAFLVAFVVTALIIRVSRSGALPWDDHELSGAQKFHARAVPRVGGFAVAMGLLALTGWATVTGGGPIPELWLLWLCGLPSLVAGLAEDVTKRVGVKLRLLATMMSGVLAFFLLGAQLSEVQFPGLDWLMTFTAFSLLFTMVATGGVANADTIAQSCAFRGMRLTSIGGSTLNGSAQDILKLGGNVQAFGDDVIVLYAAWKQDDFSAATFVPGILGARMIEIGEAVSTAGDDAGQVWNYGLRAISPGTVDPLTMITFQSVSWTITGGAAAISRGATHILRRAPQTFTVTRSINGVVKAHSAGDKITLWNTPKYGL